MSCLRSLRSGEVGHVKLVLETNVLALCLSKLSLDRIKLKSAELIQDSLSAAGLRVNDVTSVVSCFVTILAVLR